MFGLIVLPFERTGPIHEYLAESLPATDRAGKGEAVVGGTKAFAPGEGRGAGSRTTMPEIILTRIYIVEIDPVCREGFARRYREIAGPIVRLR
jgi:hypothetical protein